MLLAILIEFTQQLAPIATLKRTSGYFSLTSCLSAAPPNVSGKSRHLRCLEIPSSGLNKAPDLFPLSVDDVDLGALGNNQFAKQRLLGLWCQNQGFDLQVPSRCT